MSELRVGVAGLGNMGFAIAERLLEIVPEVAVYDVRTEPMHQLAERGALPVTSVEELAASVDVIVAALPSAEICREVAAHAAGSPRLAVYIETSTVGVECLTDIAAFLPRVSVIDAPLSGGPRGVRTGTISSFISGAADARTRVAPWFDQLCGTQIVIGEQVGLAQIAKIVNNAISLSGMVIASEAIAVGVSAGIDPLALVDAVNAGTGRNSATASKIPTSVLTGRFDFGGPIFLAEKDLELYIDMAASAGIGSSTVEASLEAFREAIMRFGGSADYTEIARVFESAVGAEIRHRPSRDPGAAPLWRSETLD